jgi:signal transduction histidine kinase
MAQICIVETTLSFESANARADAVRAARLVVAGELVAAITHDLRQPLTAIEMNVAAALRRLELSIPEGVSPELADSLAGAADALRDALAEQHRMREALQVLQDLAARREPSFAAVDLGESVNEVVRLVSSEASARHIRIDIVTAVDLPPVAADATLVRQALLNVLLDALEATGVSAHDDGPVVVGARAGEPGTVDVIVTHYGARTDSAGGWGLALARSVTDLHGGSLRVSGDAEQGFAVTTRWPMRNGAHDHSVREAARAHP